MFFFAAGFCFGHFSLFFFFDFWVGAKEIQCLESPCARPKEIIIFICIHNNQKAHRNKKNALNKYIFILVQHYYFNVDEPLKKGNITLYKTNFVYLLGILLSLHKNWKAFKTIHCLGNVYLEEQLSCHSWSCL